MTAAAVLRGHHSELGDLYAAWALGSDHVAPSVRITRFAAQLAPFPSREAAERALLAEGAIIETLS